MNNMNIITIPKDLPDSLKPFLDDLPLDSRIKTSVRFFDDRYPKVINLDQLKTAPHKLLKFYLHKRSELPPSNPEGLACRALAAAKKGFEEMILQDLLALRKEGKLSDYHFMKLVWNQPEILESPSLEVLNRSDVTLEKAFKNFEEKHKEKLAPLPSSKELFAEQKNKRKYTQNYATNQWVRSSETPELLKLTKRAGKIGGAITENPNLFKKKVVDDRHCRRESFVPDSAKAVCTSSDGKQVTLSRWLWGSKSELLHRTFLGERAEEKTTSALTEEGIREVDKYMCTGKLSENISEEIILDIYIVADMFDFDALRSDCAKKIKEEYLPDEDTTLELLQFAKDRHYKALIDMCLESLNEKADKAHTLQTTWTGRTSIKINRANKTQPKLFKMIPDLRVVILKKNSTLRSLRKHKHLENVDALLIEDKTLPTKKELSIFPALKLCKSHGIHRGANEEYQSDNVAMLGIDSRKFPEWIGDKGFASIYQPILDLCGMQMVDLSHTKITDLSPMKGITISQLISLRLTGLQIKDFSLLPRLEKLWHLNLSGTNITDAGLAHLSELKNLRQLDLSGTNITDAGLAHLSGLKMLFRLNLSGTNITDAGLAHLSGLYRCNIGFSNTKTSPLAVAALKNTHARLRKAIPQD